MSEPVQRSTSSEPVKVVIRLADPEGPASESIWATPVDAGDAGGSYRVENLTFFAPFVPGDLVACTLDADSRYQVTALLEARRVYSGYGVLPDRDDETGARDHARAVAKQLTDGGAKVEFASPTLFAVCADGPWLPGLLNDLTDAGQVVEWDLVRSPGEPVDLGEVDRTVLAEPTVAAHTSSYWAADDPYWAAHDLDDPDFLAFVQDLAAAHAGVAHALEHQRHHQVLTFIDRVAAIQRGEQVPPLDGPIFTDD